MNRETAARILTEAGYDASWIKEALARWESRGWRGVHGADVDMAYLENLIRDRNRPSKSEIRTRRGSFPGGSHTGREYRKHQQKVACRELGIEI